MYKSANHVSIGNSLIQWKSKSITLQKCCFDRLYRNSCVLNISSYFIVKVSETNLVPIFLWSCQVCSLETSAFYLRLGFYCSVMLCFNCTTNRTIGY